MWLRPWHLINSSTSPTAIRLDQIWPSCHGAYPVSTSRRMTAVATSKTASSSRHSVLIDFALQGGGAHGAFTWGALDRLLEESWLQIDGISGTPAGAMNAAVLVDGHARGGAEAARSALEAFWRNVSRAALLSPLRRGFLDVLLDRWSLDHSPVFVATDMMARLFSPYDLNPGGFNPLRQILAESVDFERLGQAPIKLFVTATNVRTGQGRVFLNREITLDVLLASACLPTMFQAVKSRARIIGTAATPATPPSRPWCEIVIQTIQFSCRSTLSSAQVRRRPLGKFSIVSTKSPSMPFC